MYKYPSAATVVRTALLKLVFYSDTVGNLDTGSETSASVGEEIGEMATCRILGASSVGRGGSTRSSHCDGEGDNEGDGGF